MQIVMQSKSSIRKPPRTEDSGYGWNETDNWEYCEEKDARIIPERWYEGVSFTEEFDIVDMSVIAWRYQQSHIS